METHPADCQNCHRHCPGSDDSNVWRPVWNCVVVVVVVLTPSVLCSVPVGVVRAEQPDGCHVQGGESDDV